MTENDLIAYKGRTIKLLMQGVGGGVGVLGVGCWAITPEKIEHRLNGRKYIVQLAKDPPPPPASKIWWPVPKVPLTLFQNGFRSGTK